MNLEFNEDNFAKAIKTMSDEELNQLLDEVDNYVSPTVEEYLDYTRDLPKMVLHMWEYDNNNTTNSCQDDDNYFDASCFDSDGNVYDEKSINKDDEYYCEFGD